MDFNTLESLQETYLSIYETPASQSTVDKIKNAEDSKPQSTSTTPAPTQTATPAPPVRRTLNDPAELERLRGAAALKSLGDSPLGKRLLAGQGRSQKSNEIVSKSIERSGLNRDKLVKASPKRYKKMVDFASKTNDERAEIARKAGQSMAGALADKVKTNAPKPDAPKPAMDPFAAGGGNAKMKATGMTRDQVIALGNKNLQNQKPASNDDKKTGTTTTSQTKPTAQTTQTKPTSPPKSDTGSLSKEQQALYDRAYSNRSNPFGRGRIQNAISRMTPEQRRQFQAYARQKGHENDWSDYKFESYVLEYLVAEGYADTDKAALAIMANMSEEWRDSIVEQLDEGIIDTIKGWVGLARDRDTKVNPNTPAGRAVTGLQRRRQETESAMRELNGQ